MTHHAGNERLKRSYLSFLKEAAGHAEPTLDAVAKALSRFEEATQWRDFRTFHREQAVSFKRRLSAQNNDRGEKLSRATVYATLAHLKRFFQWLSMQPGCRSRLTYTDAEFFNLSDNDVRIATARREGHVPTLDQVKHVIQRMPSGTEVQVRDRAMVALILLTGARDRAVASLRLKHVDLATGVLYQDAREVQTKNSKTITTFFFPVGDDIANIVARWVEYLRTDKLWGNDDPLFPKTKVAQDATKRFAAVGLTRDHWTTAASIRKVFREAFEGAGLPYFNPHSLRSTLAQLGQTVCKSPEEYKAWSQNLGHEQVLTTFHSYGHVATPRQGEIFRGFRSQRIGSASSEIAAVGKQLEQINATFRSIQGNWRGPLP